MKMPTGRRCPVLLLTLVVAACAQSPRVQPIAAASVPPTAADELQSEPNVQSTVVAGDAAPPISPQSVQFVPKSGNIRLNFPNSDVRLVAKATLGDILHVPYSVSADATQSVSVVTARPIARASLIPFLEEQLRAAGLALTAQNGEFKITPIATARSSGMTGPAAVGYSNEVIRLKFVSADQMKKLLDNVVPGTVTGTDPTSNSITLAGTSGQRGSARDLLAQFDVDWLRSMSFAMLVPQRTDSRLIVPELDKLINAADSPTRGLVRLIAMDRLNGILAISAQPQYLDDVRRWVEILDRSGENNERKLFVYKVQNGRSRDLAQTINSAFGRAGTGGLSQPGVFQQGFDSRDAAAPLTNAQQRSGDPALRNAVNRPGNVDGIAGPAAPSNVSSELEDANITSDEATNSIIVFGTPRQYAVVEDALRKLDVLPYQVLIEAAITEVTLTDSLRFGVQWNFQRGDSNFGYSEGGTGAPTQLFPGFSYALTGTDISATLNALEKRTNVKVISAPKLMVLNNHTAALQVGDQVPIASQSAVSVQNPDAPIVNSIEYKDTGVILKVTPRVNGSGLVLLDIAQEVSDVGPNSTSGINSPVISTRRISTSIAVQDGQVIALGGLFKDSKVFGKNGIPILSRIPILGALFGTHVDTRNRTELLVILKPRVLRTIDDGRAITEELRAKLRTLEPFRTQGKIP